MLHIPDRKEKKVVDVWFNGMKYEFPKGAINGRGLRLFFGVKHKEYMYIMFPSGKVEILIEPDNLFFVNHWDRFYSIAKDYSPKITAGPKVVHPKGVERKYAYVGPTTKWHPNTRLVWKPADYRIWINENTKILKAAKKELRGKDLAAWHAPDYGYADVLLEVANDWANKLGGKNAVRSDN